MSHGAVLTAVALVLATGVALLFRVRSFLDSTELGLRRLAADLRRARKDLASAGQLAAAVERDAARSQQALDHLQALRRRPADPPR